MPSEVSLAGLLGPDEGHQEQHDNHLDDPTDHTNANGPKRASIIQSLPNRDDHGDQHPYTRDEKDNARDSWDETENPD